MASTPGNQKEKGKKIAFLLALLFSLSAQAAEPVHFRHRGYRPKISTFKIPYRPSWVSVVKKGKVFKYKRQEFSSPALCDNLLFVGADSGIVYGIKKRSGRKIWRFSTVGSVNATPACDSEKVYFGDDKGIFYALESRTGKEVWRTPLASEISTAPAFFQNLLFVATVEGELSALEAATGQTVWQKSHPFPDIKMSIRGNSPPVIDESGRLYIGFADGTFWAVQARDGRLIWERSLSEEKRFADIDAPPLVFGDRIFIAHFDGPLIAFSKGTGKPFWTADVGTGVKMIAQGEVLYLSDSRGNLKAIDQQTGKMIWETKIGEGALTAPIIYGNIIAVGLSSSTMNFVDLKTGGLMFRRFARKGISSNPLLDEDRIYYLSNGGRLYSLKLIPSP